MQEETREYQKVISYLSQMIASGELAIGSRLPTERSLAETLGETLPERLCECWSIPA